MSALTPPDRGILKAIRRIDPTLTIQWVEGNQCWGVFHGMMHWASPDAAVQRVAKELYRDLAHAGYVPDFQVCIRTAAAQVERHKLILLVMEPDGSYRPLDWRVVREMERRAWQQRNWWAKDYIAVAHAADTETRTRLEAQRRDIWEQTRRDAVFRRLVSDALWEITPIRSVHGRPEKGNGNGHAELHADGPASGGAGSAASADGGPGVRASAARRDAAGGADCCGARD